MVDLPAGTTELECRLERATRVFVQVVDTGGEPVAGAELRALSRTGEPIHVRTELTDHNGRADLYGVPQGGFILMANTVRLEVDPARHSGKILQVIIP